MSNHIDLDGTVFRPEFRTTTSGKEVFRFSLSFYDGKDQSGKAVYGSIRVTAWNALAVNANAVIKEKDHVSVSGRLRHNTWEKDGVKHYDLELWADGIGKSISRFGPSASMPAGAPAPQADGYGRDLPQEEIPF